MLTTALLLAGIASCALLTTGLAARRCPAGCAPGECDAAGHDEV
ncbi:hypothetical protein [Actinosynnema mirum]|uniref:Uncharacterized protein n=1 Tax=Actinosynnema mirum (strain ATCC 29888 / DSM 43827 / JCM 3225 / NBRC 14064 / NCIMB 13271 / NRRL B-12336 / IMRU 3971 / 101) TaxID=446462 RepID=C6WM04_ACTMD|nr:hypothetical protein [Actinosynnema mirum]ACU40389.1 hypothetical protein Amir_6591 [Actinosynnema mirum DSM 43827]AXX33901.1 hypothetical protein APASM_6536 [Actinosynnema pretiosum subsp. pretiosum]